METMILDSIEEEAGAAPGPLGTPMSRRRLIGGGLVTVSMAANQSTRWGPFALPPTVQPGAAPVETPALRPNFPWNEGESPWSHRYGRNLLSEASAGDDSRVPLPAWRPAEDKFLAATVLSDSDGPADGLVAFIRSSHPDVQRYARKGDPTGDDRTLAVMWTARAFTPMYVRETGGPIPLNSDTLATATVVQDELRLTTIGGHEAIVRLWSPRDGQNMYGARLPTVIINWYEGRILWSVQSTFLSLDEAMRVAESVRPTETAR